MHVSNLYGELIPEGPWVKGSGERTLAVTSFSHESQSAMTVNEN